MFLSDSLDSFITERLYDYKNIEHNNLIVNSSIKSLFVITYNYINNYYIFIRHRHYLPIFILNLYLMVNM